MPARSNAEWMTRFSSRSPTGRPRVGEGARLDEVVALEDELDPHAASLRLDDRLRDRPGVDLLDGDRQCPSSAAEELADDGLEVVGRPEDGRTGVELDAANDDAHAEMVRRGTSFAKTCVPAVETWLWKTGPCQAGLDMPVAGASVSV